MFSSTQGLFAAASVVVWFVPTDWGTVEKATVRDAKSNEEIAQWWGEQLAERQESLNRPSLPARK